MLNRLLPVVTTVALLGAWEVLTQTNVLPPEVPPLTEMFRWTIDQPAGDGLWSSLVETLRHWAWGLVAGVLAGISIGVLIGSVTWARLLLQGPLEFMRAIPSVVYLPVLVLVIGATSETVVILVAVAVCWPMLFQTLYGVQAIDSLAIETARMFGLTQFERFYFVTLRSILPFLATGMRIASSLALVVAISVELIGGVPGLGYELFLLGQNEIYPGVYSAIFIAGVLGVILNVGLGKIERRLLRWHVSTREA